LPSSFATVKGEMIDHDGYETRAEAIASIADCIDVLQREPVALDDRIPQPNQMRTGPGRKTGW
jgi:hypothetical protein